jgi:FixJ family two-component response regulator
MIVDDDLAVLESLAELFELECGADVTAFGSAEEVMAASSPASFDVCVLDYNLTGTDGLTLGAMLRQLNPSTRLILLSGDLPANVESLAREHGFGEVLRKPISPRTLVDAIAH